MPVNMPPRQPLSFMPGASLAPAGAAVLLALAGCATPASRPNALPKYVAPAGAATAKLVMRGNLRAGDLYGVYAFDDAEACKGPRVVGAGTVGRDAVTVPIAAGQLTTLEFLLFSGKDACRVRWSFTPTAGRNYLMVGGVVTNVPGASCGARILDATDPDKIKPASDAVRRNLPGNACLAMTQAKANAGKAPDGGQSGGDAVLQPGATADDLKGLIQP